MIGEQNREPFGLTLIDMSSVKMRLLEADTGQEADRPPPPKTMRRTVRLGEDTHRNHGRSWAEHGGWYE